MQRYLGVAPLAEIVATANANGAMRLLSCPSREPIEALTLTFLDGEVHASLVVSDDDIWERLACGGEVAHDAQFVLRERTFSGAELPAEMRGWQPAAGAIARAKSCISDYPDAVSYFHFAFGAGLDSFCVWFNPTQAANPIERQIIADYSMITTLL